MTLDFFIPMKSIPTVTAQEKGINFKTGRVYTKPEVLEVKQKFRAALAPKCPEEPISGAIFLRVYWLFPETANHKSGEYKITKPDTDNMIKLLKDVMTELGYWYDDAQVAVETQSKIYSNVPGIDIHIENLQRSVCDE